ncbi:hypothetical protein RIE95_15125 [Acidithiobacillus thiooxidans]|uniref:VOC family protein n=1 Tax=Acidithiobacillus thiooxidans TaxID=930 RepID=UPI0028587540|nr:VOC family protein [Acidithiobacillus thiooxidans]MDR7928297.1 hypothetical protein [Acidithiobacillus thiooxidans]
MQPPQTIRVARPVTDLDRSVTMYKHGLGLSVFSTFSDHGGFDGVMLGNPGSEFHLEFTFCRHHQVIPAPTQEDLLVFYMPDRDAWAHRCAALLSAGFLEVQSFNPYWSERGRTFEDADGYRVVIQQAAWSHNLVS